MSDKTKQKTVRLTFRVEPATVKRLAALAKRRRTTPSKLIRRSIEMYLEGAPE